MLLAQPYQFWSSAEIILAGQQQKAVPLELMWLQSHKASVQSLPLNLCFLVKKGNESLETTNILWNILVQEC